MSLASTIGLILSGGVATTTITKVADWLSTRRTDRSKRVETTAQADATIKTKRIDDGAALRGELWERIEKLEKRQDECAKENAELKVALGQRDTVVAQLTREVQETRTRLDRAEQRAAAAERRCEALAGELLDLRRSVA